MGIDRVSANSGRSCVCTMTITAPQRVHRIGGRSLIHAVHWPGTNFRSTCSKAIRRLQLGCRKPKLRARRKPLGSTCCRTSQRKSAPETVRCSSSRSWRCDNGSSPGRPCRRRYRSPDDSPVKIAPQIDEGWLAAADGFAIHHPLLRIATGRRQPGGCDGRQPSSPGRPWPEALWLNRWPPLACPRWLGSPLLLLAVDRCLRHDERDMRVIIEPARVRVQHRNGTRRPLKLSVILAEGTHRVPAKRLRRKRSLLLEDSHTESKSDSRLPYHWWQR
jgi:hypothetical protein